MNSSFLPGWVLAHAARSPEAPAVATPEDRLSYGDLARRMQALAAHLAANEVGRAIWQPATPTVSSSTPDGRRRFFKVGGHRVGPAEIEHALERHPEVAEAAVVAVKSELAGEAVAAFVVRRKGGAVGKTELRRFCRELLPAYMVPAAITFVENLPRNAAGKLLRAQIAASGSGEEGP
jgi:acyl-coenzyme A synthetase/AMP-(fatty) acid ligase